MIGVQAGMQDQYIYKRTNGNRTGLTIDLVQSRDKQTNGNRTGLTIDLVQSRDKRTNGNRTGLSIDLVQSRERSDVITSLNRRHLFPKVLHLNRCIHMNSRNQGSTVSPVIPQSGSSCQIVGHRFLHPQGPYIRSGS